MRLKELLIFIVLLSNNHCANTTDSVEINQLKVELVQILDKLNSLALVSKNIAEPLQDKIINSKSRILFSYDLIKTYTQVIYEQIISLENRLDFGIKLIFIIHRAICFIWIIFIFGVILQLICFYLSIRNQNLYLQIIFRLLSKNSLHVLCFCAPLLLNVIASFIPDLMSFIIRLDDLEIFRLIISLFSQIALYIIIRDCIYYLSIKLTKLMNLKLNFNFIFNIILCIRLVKTLIITLLSLTNYSELSSFLIDINSFETTSTMLFLIVFLVANWKMISFRINSIIPLLRYSLIPILLIAGFAYISNNHNIQLAYKMTLALLVVPVVMQIVQTIKYILYRKLYTLPSYELSYPIRIYLIISITLKFLVIPISTGIISVIFRPEILMDALAVLSIKYVYQTILIVTMIYMIRIALIINHYLASLYIQININKRPFDTQRITTSGVIIKFSLSALLILSTIFVLLSILDIDTSPLFNSFGLLAAALSISLQQTIRDLVNGMFILYENSVRIGDWIEYNDKTAIVEDMTLRVIRVRFDDGVLLTIPFHRLDIIKNKSRQVSYIIMNISIDKRNSIDDADNAIQEAFQNLRNKSEFKHKIINDLEMRDIADVTSFSYVIQCRICVQPNSQYKIRRAFNRFLKESFDKHEINIAVPVVANAINVPSLNTGISFPDFQ